MARAFVAIWAFGAGGDMIKAKFGNGGRAPPRSGTRRLWFGFFAGLMIAGLFSASVPMPALAQEETEGITGYVACLDAAVRRIDDGRSDVAAVAAAAAAACVARFPEPATPSGKVSPAAQKKYERHLQARQMELSTMVVQDLRGQP